MSKDDYWRGREANDKLKESKFDEKDRLYREVDVPSMRFSAAQDRAVALVSAALANDALSFGSVAKGKKLDMLLGFVDQVTRKFYADNMDAPALALDIEQEADIEVVMETSKEDIYDE